MIAYTNYENDPRVIRAAEAAVEAKYDVDFLALRRAGQPAVEMIRGVRVHRLPQERYRGKSRVGYLTAYLTFFLRCVVASGRMHFAKRYKVVHVNNMPDVLVFSAIIPKLFGAGVILDIHDPMPETFGSKFVGAKQGGFFRLLVFLERMSVRFADRTITVNEPVRDSVLLTHGYRAEEIDVIANFADDKIFTLLPPAPVDTVVRFVFHGTILERYGLRTLIQAVAKVRHRARMQIRLIGEGDFSAGLKDLIASHGVGDVVDFRNRVYPLHDIPRQLSDCHVGLVPLDVTSITNFALPLKLIEYTCLGLPSITVRSTAIEHYLRPDECMFYEAGNADSLAAVLDEVAANPDRLPEFRRRLAVPRERMSWTREKDRYIGILRALSGEAAAAAAPSLAGKQP